MWLLNAGGLMATAVVNIIFGFGNAYVYFCFIWATNGILQVGTTNASLRKPLKT